jgi:A/G-specific adenine glycosylase
LKKVSEFSFEIQSWYLLNKRDMPWRKSNDPYVIWLSEIILQQTQVIQGTPYFEKFIEAFPTLKHLAESTEDKVLILWQGLGYYSRARNLYETARFVYYNLGGQFPKDYQGLLKLKGIGDYTASAIASIAYNEPKAVVDGNVVRVIARLFKVEQAFDTAEGKHAIKQIAENLLDKLNPGQHNQAMMELGSLICKYQNPLCSICPANSFCLSGFDNSFLKYPVKTKKVSVKQLHYNFLVLLNHENKTWITRRTENGIWKNMFSFPLLETDELVEKEDVLKSFIEIYRLNNIELLETSSIKHTLSHRSILATFYLIRTKEGEKIEKNNIFEVGIEELKKNYSIPRLLSKYLEIKEVIRYFD